MRRPLTKEQAEMWRAPAQEFAAAARAYRQALARVAPDAHQDWVDRGLAYRIVLTEVVARYELAESQLPTLYLAKMREILEAQIPTGWPWQEEKRPS